MYYSASTKGFYDPDIHAAIPADAVAITADEHAALLSGQASGLRIVSDANGCPILADPLPPSAAQIEAAITAAVDRRLDEFAQTRKYTGIVSACSWADSTDPVFAAEGAYCKSVRDATWRTLRDLLDAVQAGSVVAPTCYADVEPLLPPLEWPDD